MTVKGPRQLTRDFDHPKVKIKPWTDDHVIVSCEYPKVKEKALVGTFALAHPEHDRRRDQGGFEYHMKMVYSHFPMKATVKGDKFVIENFLGEKAPRIANIIGQSKVTVKGAEVVVTGVDLEARSPRRRPTSSAPAASRDSTPGSSRTAYTSSRRPGR